MWESFVDWLERSQGGCLLKSHTGMECPGCGIQRALVLLLRGEVWESIQMYPALIPLLLSLLFTVFHLIFKFKQGGKIILFSFIGTLVIMIVSYIVKHFL